MDEYVNRTGLQLDMSSNSTRAVLFLLMSAWPAIQSASADVIDNCLNRPLAHPCYSVLASTPDVTLNDHSEPSPIDMSQMGIDPRLVGSGDAFVSAGFRSLRSKSEVFFTSSNSTPGSPLGVFARATFDDDFPWNGRAGVLHFTLDLKGELSTVGLGNGASVEASFSGSDNVDCPFPFSQPGFGRLTAPGTLTVDVGVCASDFVSVEMILDTGADAAGFGSAISDFKHTFDIPKIQLFDESGNFIRDAALTDADGRVLGVASPAAVPEPASPCLMGGGLLGCGLMMVWHARRIAPWRLPKPGLRLRQNTPLCAQAGVGQRHLLFPAAGSSGDVERG